MERNIRKTLQDIGTGKDFLNKNPIAQEIIASISKWDCRKFTDSYSVRNEESPQKER